jgi:3-dehydroshikimate dehydratase
MKKIPRTGVVSISFRELSVPEIVGLCVRSACRSVEWGGDIHVPTGNISQAREAAALCAENDVAVAAYGSYCRLGSCDDAEIEKTVATALALGAPIIRVWAGENGSEKATREEREKVVANARKIADMSDRHGMQVGLEFHANTLTDSTDSTVRLLHEISRPNLRTLWQVPVSMPFHEAIRSLEQVLPWLAHLHVFHWRPTSRDRLRMIEGAGEWKKYLRVLKDHDLSPDLLLEFLPQDNPELLAGEVATLDDWLSEIYSISN